MKTMLRATVMVLSLGTGAAYADGGDLIANTQFTEIPGVLAQAPVQQVPSAVATNQNGVTHNYVTQGSHGTWLYPPAQDSGAN
jgi:hypothetical protein